MATKALDKSKYAELLKQSDKEKDQSKINFKVEDAELSLQKQVLETKKKLSTERGNLSDYKSAFPLDVQAILNTQLKVEDLEDVLKRVEQLREELFG